MWTNLTGAGPLVARSPPAPPLSCPAAVLAAASAGSDVRGCVVMTLERPRVRRRRRVQVVAEPFACDGDWLCLEHYGTLDPPTRARVRRQAGIVTAPWRREHAT
jgi:hypothetical protein